MIPIAMAGRCGAGSLVPSVGRVAELRASATDWGQALVSWTAVNAYRFAVYVDSYLAAVTTGTSVTIPGLDGGAHNISVIAIGDTESPAELRPEWDEGDQAVVSWARVDDPAVVKYVVDGTDVSSVTITPENLAPETGSGSGRLRTGGAFSGAGVNEPIVLTVSGDRLEYSVQDLTGSVPIAQGETAQLPFGVSVLFVDAAATYIHGDVYHFPLFIDTEILSAVLTRGTHEFDIAAVTANGVQGDASVAEVFVPSPNCAGTFALRFDEEEELLYLDFTLTGSHCAGCCAFANIDCDGTLLELVDELTPHGTEAGLTGSILLGWDGVTSGVVRVIPGIVATWGYTVRELSVLEMTMPIPAAVFGVPEIVTVEQVGTALRIRVAYYAVSGDDSTKLTVLRSGPAGDFTDVVNFSPGPVNKVSSFSVLIDGTDVDGAVVEVTAWSGNDGLDGAVSGAVSVTMELHEPDAPGTSWSAPA